MHLKLKVRKEYKKYAKDLKSAQDKVKAVGRFYGPYDNETDSIFFGNPFASDWRIGVREARELR